MLFKLALALHMSLRFAEANEMYQRAFDFWTPPRARRAPERDPADRDELPARTTPTRVRRSRGRTSSCACSCSTGSSRPGPSARSCPRSPSAGRSRTTGCATCSTCARGCGGRDGEPLTAHDVEFGIKRVLNPDAPGSSVAIYFVLENGQDYYLRRNDGRRRDRRAGARRPDGRVPAGRAGPVLHERDEPSGRRAAAAARDRARRRRVDGDRVAGRERRVPDRLDARDDRLVLERRDGRTRGPARATSRGVEFVRSDVADAVEPYARDELDLVTRPVHAAARRPGPGRRRRRPPGRGGVVLGYIAFDHADPVLSNVDLRRALAHAVDRDALDAEMPDEPRGRHAAGSCRPRCRGTRPTSCRAFDPDAARACLERSGVGDVRLHDRRVRDVGAPVPRDRDVDVARRARHRRARSGRGRSSRRRTLTQAHASSRRSTSRGGCRATPIPSTSCGCCSTRTAGPTRAGSRTRRSTS